MLNNCQYSLTHHWANCRRLLKAPPRAERIYQAFQEQAPEREFDGKERVLLQYAAKLTVAVGQAKVAAADTVSGDFILANAGVSEAWRLGS